MFVWHNTYMRDSLGFQFWDLANTQTDVFTFQKQISSLELTRLDDSILTRSSTIGFQLSLPEPPLLSTSFFLALGEGE